MSIIPPYPYHIDQHVAQRNGKFALWMGGMDGWMDGQWITKLMDKKLIIRTEKLH